jgi:hypothetical protein
MRKFLQEVHEFKEGKIQLNEWEAALSLSAILTAPEESTLADIKKAVETRDALIRGELVDFIAGSRNRVDI